MHRVVHKHVNRVRTKSANATDVAQRYRFGTEVPLIAAIYAVSIRHLVHFDGSQRLELRPYFFPQPDGEMFRRWIFQAVDFVETVVVQLFVKRIFASTGPSN